MAAGSKVDGTKARAQAPRGRDRIAGDRGQAGGRDANGVSWFALFAHAMAHWAGRPATFLACLTLVLIWAAAGPFFGYSDTWQLVINTSTTIITFLMVFLIQNTQNRDSMAVQVKLAELIYSVRGAENRLAAAEDLSEEELEQLHRKYHELAAATLTHLKTRRRQRS